LLLCDKCAENAILGAFGTFEMGWNEVGWDLA